MLRLPSEAEQGAALEAFVRLHMPDAQRSYLLAEMQAELGAASVVRATSRNAYGASLVGFETVAFDREWRDQVAPSEAPAWRELVWPSFRLRRGMLASPDRALQPFADELLFEVVAGLVAQRIPEVRMQLGPLRLDWADEYLCQPWDALLEQEVQRIFLLLARKGRGRGDLLEAGAAIGRLHDLQQPQETALAASGAAGLDESAARVLALYNATRACEIALRFLEAGHSPTGAAVSEMGARDDIDSFISDARDVLSGLDPRLRMKVWRLRFGLHALVESSVYALHLPRSVGQLVDDMAQRRSSPILDCWYPQRQAIDAGNLLDPTRSAVVVSLPTSSGKTLLAEMAITQSLADDNGRAVYLAPTRALVNQVARNLKRDLGTNAEVRIASPAYELDEVENEVLSDDFNVLVTTPEKFDLLFRIGHVSVKDVSLVVVDEAHNLACGERGARLELLLSSLRRERRCRFLLLTPFAKNASELATWLGGQRGASVHVDWRPNDRMVAVASVASKNRQPYLKLETVATAHSDFPEGVKASLGPLTVSRLTREEVAIESAVRLAAAKRAGVLLLASSVAKAEGMAAKAAALMPPRVLGKDAQIVAEYLETEAGSGHPMRELMEHGVVYHHAGLSPEGRYLVERLVEQGSADVVSATTTLAQGVHFPLSAAVIEGTHRTTAWTDRQGETHFQKVPIPPEEFWNIAGRVGRAMEDPLGTIVFSTTSASTRQTVRKYLEADADRVVSSLLQVVDALRNETLDLTETRSIWRFQELSAFVQYVLHAVAVSGVTATRREIDALVRGSLVFQMAFRESPQIADRLTRLAKDYLDKLASAKGDSIGWYSKMADGTGFSSGSVDLVYGRLADTVSADQWRPDEVFTMLLLQVVCAVAAVVMGIRARRKGDKSALGLVSLVLAALVGCFWLLAIGGEILQVLGVLPS